MSNSEERILEFVARNGSITRSETDKLLNVSQSTANRILRHMVDEGLLYREGDGKRSEYRRK